MAVALKYSAGEMGKRRAGRRRTRAEGKIRREIAPRASGGGHWLAICIKLRQAPRTKTGRQVRRNHHGKETLEEGEEVGSDQAVDPTGEVSGIPSPRGEGCFTSDSGLPVEAALFFWGAGTWCSRNGGREWAFGGAMSWRQTCFRGHWLAICI